MQRQLTTQVVDQIEKTVLMAGWVAKIRDHGGIIFIDLRDSEGIIQLVVSPEDKDNFEIAQKLGQEFVISVEGKVAKRDTNLINKNIPTGQIEIHVTKLTLLNKCKQMPFPVDTDGREIDEQVRLKYRFLDIRRPRVAHLIKKRHELILYTRNWFSEHGFTEIQTPLLTVDSPEGARNFYVPSRIYPGKFYVLPQAPQQYKQLLMVGGVNRYFQIAPCFRDEDPRADRHSGEFYQIDVECSFVDQEQFLSLVEPYFKDSAEAITDKKLLKFPLDRIPFKESMEIYGSDKPDLRFGLKLTEVGDIFKQTGLSIFEQIDTAKAVLVNKDFTRKEVDELTEKAKLEGAKGLAYIKLAGDKIEGGLAKYFTPEMVNQLKEAFVKSGYTQEEIKDGKTIFAIAGPRDKGLKTLKLAGWLRSQLGDILGLKDPNILAYAWIIDFPMYEWDDKANKWEWGHNPFSMIKGGLEAIKTKSPDQILTEQYDLVCNGYEIASGSIRNYQPELFIEAFKIVGYTEKQVREQFGHMLSAFEYGAPPHGGFAPGIDRIMMNLFDEANIKEIYAFPKSNAQEFMTGCPREVDQKDLDILGIQLKESAKK